MKIKKRSRSIKLQNKKAQKKVFKNRLSLEKNYIEWMGKSKTNSIRIRIKARLVQ